MEDINNILNPGEVPNMWKTEDKDAILNEIKDIKMKRKTPESINLVKNGPPGPLFPEIPKMHPNMHPP